MNLDDHTYELIDQYLQGELPENHPFVQDLAKNPALAKEVELRKLLEGAVVDYRLLEVQKALSDNKAQFIKENTFRWNWLYWALPALIVATTVYFYNVSTQHECRLPSLKTYSKKLPQPEQDKAVAPNTKNVVPNTTTKTSKTLESTTKEIPVASTVQQETSVDQQDTVSSVKTTEKTEALISVPTQKVTHTDPCLGIQIKAYVAETRPCVGSSEGQLLLKNVTGGQAPYRYAIDGKTFQNESLFTGLPESEYHIHIKDINNCETTVYNNYSLKSKTCISYAEHVFNPTLNTWEVPTDPEKQGEITVVNPNGQMVFSQIFNKSEKLNWNGLDNSGGLLLPSVYIYTIKYADGVVEQGKITITY